MNTMALDLSAIAAGCVAVVYFGLMPVPDVIAAMSNIVFGYMFARTFRCG